MNVLCNNNEECSVLLNSKCVFYEGEALSPSGINTNDTIEVAIQKLNEALDNSGTSLQFQYNSINLGSNNATIVNFTGAGVTATRLIDTITVNIPGGGGGSVTSFSSGNLNPLFTTVVVDAMTTPTLTFTLMNAGANTYFGNSTGVSAAPSFTSAAALTKVDDTNVTLTLTGNPSTSLLRSVGLTLGWTGTLDDSRITSSSDWNTAYNTRIASLTTTGDNGAATFISNVLNIPQYTITGLGGQPQLNGTGFVKATGTTITYDNSTYLTSISGIAAGGELTGTYPNPTLSNSAVISKVLTGFVSGAGSISASDTILSAIQKLDGNITAGGSAYWKVTGTSTLTGNATIAMSTFNVSFLNGNSLFGGTGDTITTNTKIDIRGIGSGTNTVIRVADNINAQKILIQDNARFSWNDSTAIGTTTLGVFRAIASDANILLFKNSSNQDAVSIGVNGEYRWTSNLAIYQSSNDGTVGVSGTGIIFTAAGTFANPTSNFYFVGNGGAFNTTGVRKLIRIGTGGQSWNPSSSTGEFANIYIDSTYAATSTWSGAVYGFYYNPTITSLASGKHYGIVIAPSGALNGFGVSIPTAKIHLGAGTSTANTSPLKFTAGTNLTAPEAGAFEFDGTNYFVTASTTRYTLAKTLTATASLNFPPTPVQTSSDLTITVTGAAVGDVVELGVPSSAVIANTCYTAFVSAADTVTVRLNNYDVLASADPGAATFRVSVLKY